MRIRKRTVQKHCSMRILIQQVQQRKQLQAIQTVGHLAHGDTAPFAQIGGFCGRENSLRLSAGNSWWTSGYVNVNLAKPEPHKKVISEDEINEKLSKDIHVVFKVNFDIPNPEQAGIIQYA